MDRAPICQNGPVLAPYEVGAPSRLRHLVISTLIALALVSHTALTSLHAQTLYPIDDWAETGGTVDLSRSMDATDGVHSLDLPIRKGESATYYLRLSKQPKANGWWVRVHVDGDVYIDGKLEEKGIWWVPSVGWEIQQERQRADAVAQRHDICHCGQRHGRRARQRHPRQRHPRGVGREHQLPTFLARYCSGNGTDHRQRHG